MTSPQFMKTPKPSPPLNIPESSKAVKVSIINTTSRIRIPAAPFFQPAIFEILDCPAFSFLIQSSSGRNLLFDLGVRKDWQNLAPKITDRIKDGGWVVTVEKDVAEILEDHGVKRESVEGIIWSHHHWDHTGNPSTFPPTTALIVGPGFTSSFTPGFPSNPEAPILVSDYDNRTLREISFDEAPLTIGRYRAIDYFNDGSFYLLDSPGHAIGHMCALARTSTSPDTFILMGGDVCHHGGEFRPTEYLPLPRELKPNPLDKHSSQPCPGSIFEAMHRNKRVDEPFLEVTNPEDGTGISHDFKGAVESIRKLEDFDGNDDVFTVIAHDESLLDVVEFFPTTADGWKEKGWAEKGRWAFLGDFKEAAQEAN